MSTQKPKQQQASLFSFFKKPETKTDTSGTTEATVKSSTQLAPQKAPVVPAAVPSKPSPVKSKPTPTSPQRAKLTQSPKKTVSADSKQHVSKEKVENDLMDTDEDDDSFALGKKRRVQKSVIAKNDKEGSASKKAKISETESSKKTIVQKQGKKGTLQGLEDEDDDDAEFGDEESDEDGSAYSDEESEDDSSMDVDDEDDDDLDDEDESDDDDDDYGRKKKQRQPPKKQPTSKAKAAVPAASKPPLSTKARSSITPSKAPLTSLKTPAKTSTTSSSPQLFTTPRSDGGTEYEDASQASGSKPGQPTSASKIALPEGVMGAGKHDHDSYTFLFPENIRDGNNRRPNDPCYNPRTLKVPPRFLQDQTPAMAQWWQFKAQNMDTVLFFKVGKFYELFHMDADIGYKELDLIYMKGTKAHSGFPEVSYGKFASILVTKGYRVARVEQTETPDMLKERNDSAGKGTKKEKVVTRELCSIMTKGTRTFNHMDDLTILDELGPDATTTSLLLAICELDFFTQHPHDGEEPPAGGGGQHLNTHSAWAEYGLCCVDTVLSTVTIAQFQDDRQRTRLRTFLARYNPTEVLLEDNAVSAYTTSVLELLTPTAAKETLRIIDQHAKTGSLTQEMPSAEETLQYLAQGHYFPLSNDENRSPRLPAIVQMLEEAYRADGSSGSLALRALGGCLWQLKRSLIDHEIVSMGVFEAYVPPDDHLHDSHNNEDDEPDSAITSNNTATMMDVDDFVVGDRTNTTGTNNTTSFFSSSSILEQDATITAEAAQHKSKQHYTLYTKNPLVASAIAPVAKSVMILDETTLTNLEVLVNNYDKTEKHSLWHFMNHTVTLGGRRLLRSWLCHPLYEPRDIQLRQEAVQEFCAPPEDALSDPMVLEKARKLLRNIPDLERLLLRVHSNGLKKKHVLSDSSSSHHDDNEYEHPDHRAVMFEAHIYTMRKIKDFADILSGFETVAQIARMMMTTTTTKSASGTIGWKSRILQYLFTPDNYNSTTTTMGIFPLQELQQVLTYFRDIFDEKQAKKEGQIKPKPGINPDYDQAVQRIQQIHANLEAYLKEMKRSTGIHDIVYFGTGKDRFQLEIPMAQTSKVPKDWQSKSQKKTHRRYWTPTLEQSVASLIKAEEDMTQAQQDTLRQLFAKFDQHRRLWQIGAQVMSIMDALLSLATISKLPNYTWPDIVPFASSPNDVNNSNNEEVDEEGVVLEIVQGRHPMLEQSLLEQQEQQESSSSSSTSTSFIPNSLQLGGLLQQKQKQRSHNNTTTTATASSKKQHCARTLVLTGPNMGGKSTLLRTSCLLTLMGQLGCKVPADSCRYTPVDRIFTRLGASDRLLAGQSTFFVELAETSLLLRASTRHSLCILDELGRGTATYDGTAIAHAVLEYLVGHIQCRVLFATHYHLLVDDWQYDSRVQMGHMDCLVQTRALTDKAEEEDMVEEVTFLYRLCAGSSPKSYGINVARLAGLPIEVIRMALAESARFHQNNNNSSNSSSSNNNNSNSSSSSGGGQSSSDEARYFAACRVMQALLERLVSLAHTYIPHNNNTTTTTTDDTTPTANKAGRYEERALQELISHAQELYARYSHLHQHHHVEELLKLN